MKDAEQELKFMSSLNTKIQPLIVLPAPVFVHFTQKYKSANNSYTPIYVIDLILLTCETTAAFTSTGDHPLGLGSASITS